MKNSATNPSQIPRKINLVVLAVSAITSSTAGSSRSSLGREQQRHCGSGERRQPPSRASSRW
ncbi:hypothetical protein NMG60_11003511 [Bertholletia excelsa]